MSTKLTPYQVVRYRVHQMSVAIHTTKTMHWEGLGKPISPNSDKAWAMYRGYKREASIWLTAIKIIKLCAMHQTSPDTFDVRLIIKHAEYLMPHTTSKATIATALHRLRHLVRDLDEGKKDFTAVAAEVARCWPQVGEEVAGG